MAQTELTDDIQELEFIRDYDNVSVARLWAAITDPSEVAKWFGPEGVELVDCQMDMTRRGPWHCIMRGRESGNIFKNTGVVTHVRPPEDGAEGSVGFTWAWHDNETDVRGSESHVIFEVSSNGNGARLRLIHRDLADLEAAQSHTRGWISTLKRLDRFVAEQV